ncbi:MAG TPA: hypothetical protein VGE77_09300 [Nocardioides sp.]
MSENQNAGGRSGLVSRRTIARTAAWSVPAVAVVAASPAHAVSTPDAVFDVTVTANCVNAILAPPSTVNFVISATAGTIPAGTQFQLTGTGLLGLAIGAGLSSGLSLLGLTDTGGTVQVDQPILQGQSQTVDLRAGLANVQLATTFSLALVPGSVPPGTVEQGPGANSASLTTITATVLDLGVITLCA